MKTTLEYCLQSLRLLPFLSVFVLLSCEVFAADVSGVYQTKRVIDVTINDAFWLPRLQCYRDNSIRTAWQFSDGSFQEIEHLAYGSGPTPDGVPWGEALFYKTVEAAANIVAQWPSTPDTLNPCPPGRSPAASLSAHLSNIATTMQQAQSHTSDGYVHAYVVNHDGQLQWGTYPIHPWQFLYGLHDGYVLGHLVEAAIAHYNATGSTAMLSVAEKVGDQAYNHFVTQGNPGYCGHAEFELAMVELYRVSSRANKSNFLDMAQRFVDQRGLTPPADGDTGQLRAYFQDDLPTTQQTAINGHAVRATFFYTGVADLALAGRSTYYNPVYRVWKNCAKRKLYVIGGAGVYGGFDNHEWEGYSLSDYDLPNNSYCESCAAGAVVNFAHRMGRLKGDGDSIDELERSLYNNVLHGLSLDGTGAFYTNPLTDQSGGRGQSWICCQPLLYRTLTGVGKYIYGYTNSDIYVNLFIGSTCNFTIGSTTVPVTMATNTYPWDGRVTITVTPPTPTTFTMHIRMPGWCRNALLRLNGKVIAKPTISNRYIVLNRQWSNGDQVVFNMAMTPTRIEAHPSVAADVGRVCIQRGPIIFALEGVDNGGGSLADPVLSANPNLSASYNSGLLNGVEVVTGNKQGGGTLTFVPFYALVNRSNTSWQRVWVQQEGKTTRTAGWDDRLYREYTP